MAGWLAFFLLVVICDRMMVWLAHSGEDGIYSPKHQTTFYPRDFAQLSRWLRIAVVLYILYVLIW